MVEGNSEGKGKIVIEDNSLNRWLRRKSMLLTLYFEQLIFGLLSIDEILPWRLSSVGFVEGNEEINYLWGGSGEK